MSMVVLWALAAGALLIVEMLTGTLYLLALGVAAALVAVLAYAGVASGAAQLGLFALACLATAALAYLRQRATPARRSDVGAADVGAIVEVLEQRAGGYRVRYRGTEWDAFIANESALSDGSTPPRTLVVRGIEGTRLRCTYR